MSDVKYVYIQNTHNAPITCHTRDAKGKVILTKKFMPMLTEKFSGKVLHTGYERLTEDEYNEFVKTSRTFQVFSGADGGAKLLVAHNDLPAEAKSPHEALMDARKDAREAAKKIAALETEIVRLKAELLDAQNKYNALSSASTDEEKLKPLNDKIAALETEKAALQAKCDEGAKPFEAKIAALENEKTALVVISKKFANDILEAVKKDKSATEMVKKYLENAFAG